MKTNNLLRNAMLITPLILTGCGGASMSKFQYIEPNKEEVKNEKIIDLSFDPIWDRIVAKLSASFFVINNIDKQSRLINLSFSSSSPEKYINCGETNREFSFRNENKSYTYKVAENSYYKSAGKWGVYKNLPSVSEVSRDTNLEGRINIYIAPVEKNRTRVAVNVRYIFSSSASGINYGYNGFGNLALKTRVPPQELTSISFNTKQPESKNLGDHVNPVIVTCQSKGVLESELLGMAIN